jgi:hypothetical protein
MQFYLASGSFLEGPYAEKTETNDGYAKIDPGFASNCKSKTKGGSLETPSSKPNSEN